MINEVQKRKERRDEFLLNLYNNYMKSSNMELEIVFDKANNSDIKDFFYWYDKKYLVDSHGIADIHYIRYRFSAEGIEYIEGYLLNEIEK